MEIRRLLAALLVFLFPLTTYAGHELGGVIITYESAQHLNNNPLEYTFNIYMFFDKGGPLSSPPSSVGFQQTSSCYTTSNHSISLISSASGNFLPLTGSDYCSTTNTIANSWGLAHYQGTVVLPGTCSNFKFSMSSGFGRYNNMLNIAYSNGNNYYEVKLNNTSGPNSSPTLPIVDIVKAACLNKPLNLYSFSETDGDSVYYAPGNPLSAPSTYIAYSSGYSIINQVNSTAGFTVNSQTGLLQTQLSQAGVYLIVINYAEYRKNSSQQTVLSGGGQFSLVLLGSSGCNSAPFNMIHVPVANADSIGCTQNTIRVATTRKIATASLTSSGSEFTVLSKKSGTLSVSGASMVNDSVVELSFSQPIPGSDTLDVIAKSGTDGNVILSSCGKALLANADTVRFFSSASGTPVANFSHSSAILNAQFNASGSTGSLISFQWDFGDGNSGTGQNPTHTYSVPGVYNVQLVVFNNCGSTDTTVQMIRVCDSLLPAFTFTQTGDSVVFDAGNSTGGGTYSWDFGDGTSATGLVVGHRYSPGNYLLTLTVFNLCGDTVQLTDSIEMCLPPIASWTYTVVSSTSGGMLVNFDGTASTNVSQFLWNFGDGNTNTTSLTPTHTYLTPSLSYYVSLTIFNDCNDGNTRAFRLNQIGAEEFRTEPLMSIYPNPVSHLLHIDWSGSGLNEVSLSVFDLNGKVVLQQNLDLSKPAALDVAHLPGGVYLIIWDGERSLTPAYFVVER